MSNSAQTSASSRIAALLDENSFVEVGAYIAARNTDFNMTEHFIGWRCAERSGWGLQLPTAPGIFVSSEILRPGSPTATGSARQKWAIPWIRFSPSLP